eukprot:gene309-331_t
MNNWRDELLLKYSFEDSQVIQDIYKRELLNGRLTDSLLRLLVQNGLDPMETYLEADDEITRLQCLKVLGEFDFWEGSQTYMAIASLVAEPLFESYRNGMKGILERLLRMPGISVNQVDEDGCTVLFAAFDRPDLLKKLLCHPGIDANISNREGCTPLLYALSLPPPCVDDRCLDLLIEFSGKQPNELENILCVACRYHGAELLEKIIPSIDYHSLAASAILDHVLLEALKLGNSSAVFYLKSRAST